MENNHFKLSNFDEAFGQLKSVHRVRRDKWEFIFPFSILIIVFLGGVLYFISSREFWSIPVCIILPFIPIWIYGGDWFFTKDDELRIYQNGFTCQSRKKMQSCLWKEIKACRQRLFEYRETWKKKRRWFRSVQLKKSGQVIRFASGLQGTTEIVKHRRDFRKAQKEQKKSDETK